VPQFHRTPISKLLPYTTLFRSRGHGTRRGEYSERFFWRNGRVCNGCADFSESKCWFQSSIVGNYSCFNHLGDNLIWCSYNRTNTNGCFSGGDDYGGDRYI